MPILQDGSSGEEFNKDSIERDDRRLIELGWKTLELFALVHVFRYQTFQFNVILLNKYIAWVNNID